MVWYEEAVFYHIYPLGLTGAPEKNDYSAPESRLRILWPWVDHIRDLGCNALYIGPLFQSVGHGYETTDYFTLDSRLGTNEDLKAFVKFCHEKGVRVVLDGVFNHVGRDFFAFRDLLQNRENSRYRDWFCNVRFDRDNSFHDGFSYENWGGYDLLVKLNQGNPEVRQHLLDAIDFWIAEFDIDGIRLDAADVLDFGFMAALRSFADSRKGDFFLLGEVIHGDYGRWLAPGMLHCVTNYRLHKALYSGHNDHNYFEIAHTVRETGRWKLYNFVDNHDVARIASKLSAKANFLPVHVLLYTHLHPAGLSVPFHQIRSWKGRIQAPAIPAFQRTAVLRPSRHLTPSGCQQECTLSSVLPSDGRHTHRVLLQYLLPLPP